MYISVSKYNTVFQFINVYISNMRYTASLLLLFFAGILLTACSPKPAAQSAIRPALVERVQPAKDTRSASYTGEIHARYETRLSFRVGGKVVERLVAQGEQVKKGQVLARLDATDIRLTAEAAQSDLEASREQHAQARRQYKRARALLKDHSISQSLYDKRKAKLDITSAQLKRARKHLATQQNRLRYTKLRTDHAGTITRVRVESGQVVSAGQPVFDFARSGERELWVAVPESRIDTVSRGESVEITFWAVPEVRIQGRVRSVASDTDPRTATYQVRITLLDPPDSLRLGMSATAHFRDRVDGRVIRLPMTSLYHSGGKPAVWVVDEATGKVTLQPVSILRYAVDDAILAADEGLQAGALVVTKGVTKLHPGERVKPINSYFDRHGNH